MKYGIMYSAMFSYLGSFYKDKNVKKAKGEYRRIIENAKDIGTDNPLLTSYILGAFFIAVNRVLPYTPDENAEIIEKGFRKSKLFKIAMGDAKSYFSKKHIEERRKAAIESKKKKYENDWVFDFVEKDKDFEFGYDYKECGVCKLFRDENSFELAKYLCRMDYLIVDIMGIKLKRTKTIASGDDYCDFRFIKK